MPDWADVLAKFGGEFVDNAEHLTAVGLVFLAAFVSVLFWDTHRLLVLGGVTVAFFAACVLAFRQVRVRLAESQGMLRDTLAELEADRKALHDRTLP